LRGLWRRFAYRAGKFCRRFWARAMSRATWKRPTAGWKWDWREARERFAGTAGDLWRISVKPLKRRGMYAALGTDEVLLDWGRWPDLGGNCRSTDLRAARSALAFSGHADIGAASEATRATAERVSARSLGNGLGAITKGFARPGFDPRGLPDPGICDGIKKMQTTFSPEH